jgi:ankyrin repeat protein
MAQRNHKGNSALFYALSSMTAVDAQELAATELRIVESFVKRNVDLSQETFATCGCVLATAILCNRADLLRDLVVKCGVSLFVLNQPCIHVNVYDVYPLTLAVEEKHVDCVKALVELGASISCYGNRMPLMHFIVSSKSDSLKYFQAGMFDVLDKKVVNWHATHDDQGSALHVALKSNCDIEIVQFLLARCYQLISLKTGSDTSILANAIPYKSVELIEALLSHGADVNEFSLGKPLLHCVIEHCSSQYAADGEESCRAFLLQVFELLDKYEVNWSCILTPAGVSGGNQRQQSAVRHHRHHRPRIVRWQVTPTANNNSQARVDVTGEVTVLHAAILHRCHPDVIGYCLNKYPRAVDINIIEYEEERDILKLAFMSTWDSHVVSVCEMLVTAGAALPANVLNGYLLRGRLPRRQVIELLIMAGCNVRPK